jgi:hypothetical protein
MPNPSEALGSTYETGGSEPQGQSEDRPLADMLLTVVVYQGRCRWSWRLWSPIWWRWFARQTAAALRALAPLLSSQFLHNTRRQLIWVTFPRLSDLNDLASHGSTLKFIFVRQPKAPACRVEGRVHNRDPFGRE